MGRVYLSLGTNTGNKEKNLRDTIRLIQRRIGEETELSDLFETEPWGFKSEDQFLNMVLSTLTELSPEDLITECLNIEQEMGRIRKSGERYSSRIIDIDILFYDDKFFLGSNLTIPHPLIQQRRFILEPLNEIAPDFIHPVLKMTISDLLANCNDSGKVKKYFSQNS